MTQKTTQNLYTPTFFLMNLLNFLVLTGTGFFTLYPLYLENLHKTDTQIGYIMASYAVAGLLCRFLLAPLIDKYGRKLFTRLGIIIAIISAMLYSLPLPGDYHLIFVRFFHGIGHALYFTSIFTWIVDYAPKGRMAEAIGTFGI
ncbi:MAG: MFS transporter, partial [Vulcanimicrobiota bacterium]